MKTKNINYSNDLIPDYNIEKRYFKYIKKQNFRNNQNYVFNNKDLKYIKIFTNFTFYWGSRVRKKTKTEIRNKVKGHFKIFLFFLFLNIVALFFWEYILKVFVVYLIFLVIPLLFLIFPLLIYKKTLYIFDDKKYYIIIIKDKLKRR